MRCHIALGANLSNPKESFSRALELLSAAGVQVAAKSWLWRSPSWPPGQGAPDYTNAVIAADFDGRAEALLDILLRTETELGRTRSIKNAPRTLDLDLLDFGGERLDTPSLTLPHPRLQDRAFVLCPLSEVSPDWVHPISGQGVFALLAKLSPEDVAQTVRAGRF